jgi:hypothetical protein
MNVDEVLIALRVSTACYLPRGQYYSRAFGGLAEGSVPSGNVPGTVRA